MEVASRIYLRASGAEATKADRKELRFHFSHVTLDGQFAYVETAQIPTRSLASVGGRRENTKFSKRALRRLNRISTTPGAPRHTYTERRIVATRFGLRAVEVEISRDERVRFNASMYLPAREDAKHAAQAAKRRGAR